MEELKASGIEKFKRALAKVQAQKMDIERRQSELKDFFFSDTRSNPETCNEIWDSFLNCADDEITQVFEFEC